MTPEQKALIEDGVDVHRGSAKVDAILHGTAPAQNAAQDAPAAGTAPQDPQASQ